MLGSFVQFELVWGRVVLVWGHVVCFGFEWFRGGFSSGICVCVCVCLVAGFGTLGGVGSFRWHRVLSGSCTLGGWVVGNVCI